MKIKKLLLLFSVMIFALILLGCSEKSSEKSNVSQPEQTKTIEQKGKIEASSIVELDYVSIVKAMYLLRNFNFGRNVDEQLKETMELFKKGGISNEKAITTSLTYLKIISNDYLDRNSIYNLGICIREGTTLSEINDEKVFNLNKDYFRLSKYWFIENFGNEILKINDEKMKSMKVIVMLSNHISTVELIEYSKKELKLNGNSLFYGKLIREVMSKEINKDELTWNQVDDNDPEVIKIIDEYSSDSFLVQEFLINTIMIIDNISNQQKLKTLSKYLYKFGNRITDANIYYEFSEYEIWKSRYNKLLESVGA